jgi:hypothetical protein
MSIVLEQYNPMSDFARRLAETAQRDMAFEREMQAKAMEQPMRMGAMTGDPRFMQRAQQAIGTPFSRMLQPQGMQVDATAMQEGPGQLDMQSLYERASGGDVNAAFELSVINPPLAQRASSEYTEAQTAGIQSINKAREDAAQAQSRMLRMEGISDLLEKAGVGPGTLLNLTDVALGLTNVTPGVRETLLNSIASPDQEALRTALGGLFREVAGDYGRLFQAEVPIALDRIPSIAKTKEQIQEQLKVIGLMTEYQLELVHLINFAEEQGQRISPRDLMNIQSRARERTLQQFRKPRGTS